jgi:hypothetical protein
MPAIRGLGAVYRDTIIGLYPNRNDHLVGVDSRSGGWVDDILAAIVNIKRVPGGRVEEGPGMAPLSGVTRLGGQTAGFASLYHYPF